MIGRLVRAGARLGASAALGFAGVLCVSAGAPPVLAADPLTMNARVMLQGGVRPGAWSAVEVDLANNGAPISGELRVAGGMTGQVRYTTAVDLPPQSRKRFELYVQAPSFGPFAWTVLLVSGSQTIASRQASVVERDDPSQPIIGIVAEHPEPIVAATRQLAPSQGSVPIVVPLAIADLPGRAEAWSTLDRLVWQDVDTSALSPDQLGALQGWVASGGRLTIVGGTNGARTFSALPDAMLPFRPTTTVDLPPATLTSFAGSPPAGAAPLPALAGGSATGRILVRNGDAIVAAEAAYGSGSVTLVGFDPDAGWLASAGLSSGIWQQLLPLRSSVMGGSGVDESTVLNALSNLPAVGLPPIGGLLLLLLGYVVLIGPVNYLVLRRLDRREWAWLTMPLLIVGFGAAAYAFGAVLRGTSLQISEVSIVRGGPGAPGGLARTYVGVFSPTRSTYQLSFPSGALVTTPQTGDPQLQGSALDVVEGQPAAVRDLAVGFASLRAVRTETTVPMPAVSADLRLEQGRLVGTVRNDSTRTLQRVAVVLGSSATTLGDLAPGQSKDVALAASGVAFGQPLSSIVLGDLNFGGPTGLSADDRRSMARHNVIDQLSFDPRMGPGQLQADGPVLLAWGSDPVVAVNVAGQKPEIIADTLYYVPLPMTAHGPVVFSPDLMRSSVVDVNAQFFNKDPTTFGFGTGTLTLAFRPIALTGTIDASRLTLAMNAGPGAPIPPSAPIKPLAPGASAPVQPADGVPNVELLDRTSGGWVALPHLGVGLAFDVDAPARFVDPSSGTVEVRFRNDRQDQIGFQFTVQLEGTVR